MQIAGMDTIAPDSGALICSYIDFKSKINFGLVSKQCLTSYKNSLQNLSLNEYIDGLYGFFFNKQAFAELVLCNTNHQILLINYKIVWDQSWPCNFALAYSTADCNINEDKDSYLKKRQSMMQTDDIIVDSMNQIITENRKEELKFLTPYFHTRLVVYLFGQNYTEECYNHIVNNICSFFGQESSLENFKRIETKINNKKLAIDEVIINKALKHNNYSALVFLLHNLYEIYSKAVPCEILSIFDTVADEKKRLLIQAGYDISALIELLRQAIDTNNAENVKSFFTIILESGNLNLCGKKYVYSYVFKFMHYDLIPKLFEEKNFSSRWLYERFTFDQIHTIIKTCYDHYGKDLWKDPRAQCFLDLALRSRGYDQELLAYFSSIIDTLPFPDYHQSLLYEVWNDKDNISFGKKIEFLLSKGIDIMLFRVSLSNDYSKDKDYRNSTMYRIVRNASEDIIIKLIQEKKQSINQVLDVSCIQDLFNCAVIAKKWRIVDYLLPNVTDDKAKELLMDAIHAKQWFYVEWLLKRKEINILKHAPDQLIKIFENCSKRDIVNHVKQANFTHNEYKEFLYRVGIRKTADVIFCMWWYAISNLKKALIYCGSLAILASIVVGLCYKLTPVNLIV